MHSSLERSLIAHAVPSKSIVTVSSAGLMLSAIYEIHWSRKTEGVGEEPTVFPIGQGNMIQKAGIYHQAREPTQLENEGVITKQ